MNRDPRPWRVKCASVVGARHTRLALPNQDAWAQFPEDDECRSIVFVIADGHGGRSSPKSQVGAKLAVNIAVQLLAPGLQDHSTTLATREAQTRETISGTLIQKWRESVEADAGVSPLDVEARDAWVAYGTTLLIAIGWPDGLVLAQLGDGDILAVAGDGSVVRPLPPDDVGCGNETASLSDLDPSAVLRVASLPIEQTPELLVLATDGYANSFRTDADFLMVGRDLQKMIGDEGFDRIANELEGWLTATSAEGSGDDITVGLLYRPVEKK